ncbi:hypothetical protein MTO96_015606 [Rhipicephalus appendiculatus]
MRVVKKQIPFLAHRPLLQCRCQRMPPPEDSRGTKQHPFVRPFYMTVRDKLDDEQPVQEPPKKPPEEPPKKQQGKPPAKPPAKPVQKPPVKPPPVPQTVTAPDTPRRLPKGFRPFKGSVHDMKALTQRAKPLITEKKVAPPVAKAAAGAPATRSFALNVKGASGGPGPRRFSATKARAAFRGPAKTAPIHIHDSSINITRNLSDIAETCSSFNASSTSPSRHAHNLNVNRAQKLPRDDALGLQPRAANEDAAASLQESLHCAN